MIDGKWFDCNDLLRNGCQVNIVNGKRDIGKSYGQLLRAHARRIRNHEGMVWVRPIAADADKLAAEFGSGKYRAIWDRFGQSEINYKRYGNRILWRAREGAPWLPMIRFVGLSEWNKMRDTDDPQERFLFLDEYILPTERLARYRSSNPPARDLLDLWISLRRGKTRFPILAAGNPELGADWLSPFLLRDRDRQTPERVRLYDTTDWVRDYCRDSDGVYSLDRVAILWTENPAGHNSGGSESGKAQEVPAGLYKARSGHERLYIQMDLGSGFVSIWYDPAGGVIVDTVQVPEKVVRLFPDGSPKTIVWSPYVKRTFEYLRQFWRLGMVHFCNVLAYVRFLSDVKKIL